MYVFRVLCLSLSGVCLWVKVASNHRKYCECCHKSNTNIFSRSHKNESSSEMQIFFCEKKSIHLWAVTNSRNTCANFSVLQKNASCKLIFQDTVGFGQLCTNMGKLKKVCNYVSKTEKNRGKPNANCNTHNLFRNE